ncbi:MAG: DUF5666 domain-containing protein [Anaerolineales bacterium]|nr:DUF5666 domain-containing protein [Anaerolineales bacterium]
MDNLDERLQKKLETFEEGSSVSAPNGNDREIEALLLMAASIRAVDGPHQAPGKVRQGKQMAMRAALAADAAAGSKSKHKSERQLAWLLLGLVPASIALLLLIPMTILMIGGGLYWNASRVAGQATVADARGLVLAANPDTPDTWEAMEAGSVREGWRVRTGGASTVTLAFHEGTRIELGPNTEIRLDEVGGGWGDRLNVAITQESGRSLHQVVPLRGDSSSYQVHTPAGATEVHGTTFSVEVDPTGDSRILVDSGEVRVAAAGEQVTLLSGQATSTRPGHTPEPPAYRFSGQGPITSIEGTTWTIGGIAVTVIDQTSLVNNPAQGDFAAVRGRIVDGDLWLADEIVHLDEGSEPYFTYSGRVQAVDGLSWLVGGHWLLLNDATEVQGDPHIGDAVKVNFRVLENGSWLAVLILNIEGGDHEPTPTPSATPDPEANPSLSFEPDELEQNGCGNRFAFEGLLVNQANGDGDYAANVLLGYTLIKNPAYVTGVTLDPGGWERIEPGEAASFNVTVELSEDWNRVPDGTEVKLRLFVAEETNRPDGHRTRLTLTIIANCSGIPTPTGTITPTATVTPTVTPTPQTTPTPAGPTDCTGANPHPHGATLAQRYGVPYEEIMGWFCQGFGFGEIEHAYTLSLETGMPVSEIFNMRKSGLGWGQIKKQLTDSGNPKKK